MSMIIYTPRKKTGTITVNTVVTGVPDDFTVFRATLTGQSAEPTIVGPFDISQESPVYVRNLPFDTYVLTVENEDGYTLDSIAPSSIVLSRANRVGSVTVTESVEPQIPPIKYGALYNWYAATDIRNIAYSGWHLPSEVEYATLASYLGGDTIAGGKMKVTGTDYWNSPNTGATNISKFNGKGAGYRYAPFVVGFGYVKTYLMLWTSKNLNPTSAQSPILDNESSELYVAGANNKIFGGSIRLIKDSTTLTNGQEGTYTGNDGKAYRTICIGTQEWLADNLCETKYRNGDAIPIVTDDTAWAALSTGAMCYYDNDINNK